MVKHLDPEIVDLETCSWCLEETPWDLLITVEVGNLCGDCVAEYDEGIEE